LRTFDFTYVLPERISLTQAKEIVAKFLSERSGGDRGLAVAAALFETVKDRFGIYNAVRRGVVNAADSATVSAGDLECLGAHGEVLLAIEVKERQIGDDDLHIAVAKARSLRVRELLFCTEGIASTQRDQIERTMQHAWASGTSVYHSTIQELLHNVLPLTGEPGIKSFINHIGRQLDEFDTQPRHRRAWKDLLDEL
jgi:hypothetical protein